MTLEYHKNCENNRPHVPEIKINVSSIRTAMEIIKLADVEEGFLDWANIAGHRYIIKPNYVEFY